MKSLTGIFSVHCSETRV